MRRERHATALNLNDALIGHAARGLHMANPISARVSIINASTVCSDGEVKSYVEALQQQVSRDFAPVWGADAELTFVVAGTKPDPNTWWLVVLDNSDQAGALGYHDLTPAGLPIGKVFARTDHDFSLSVSVTASHELLEMLADPGINLTVSTQDDQGNVAFYAYEACDPCEDDSYGYTIDSVSVSDFVYPSWFGGVTATQFDHGGHIASSLEILSGGYIGRWTPGTGWTQLTGSAAHGAAHRSRAGVGSRRERRQVGRNRWALSTARNE